MPFPCTCLSWGHKHPKAQFPRVLVLASLHRCPTLSHIVYPLYMHRKPMWMWDERVYLGSCPSPCFGMHNVHHIQMSKSVVLKLCRNAFPTRTYEVGRICSVYLRGGNLVQIPFTLSRCNHIAIHTSHNAFIYVKLHLQSV